MPSTPIEHISASCGEKVEGVKPPLQSGIPGKTCVALVFEIQSDFRIDFP